MKHLLVTSILAIAALVPAVGFAQTANSQSAGAVQPAQDHRMSSKVHYPDSQQVVRPNQSVDSGGYGTQSSGSSESRIMPRHTLSSGAKADLFLHH